MFAVIKTPTIEPVVDHLQNELEFPQIAGATDEAPRPRFYETLLKSQVLILHAGEVHQPSVASFKKFQALAPPSRPLSKARKLTRDESDQLNEGDVEPTSSPGSHDAPHER